MGKRTKNVGVIAIFFLSLISLYSLTKAVANNIPHMEDKSLIASKDLSLATERYIDRYLSEIIRINLYNPERVKKIFCVHQIAYIERAVTAPNAIRAYAKLMCSEGGKMVNNALAMTNLVSLPSRIYLQQYTERSPQGTTQTRFKVYGDDTPRGETFYLGDIRRFLSNDMMDKVNAIKFSKADYELLGKKEADYRKSLKPGCQ